MQLLHSHLRLLILRVRPTLLERMQLQLVQLYSKPIASNVMDRKVMAMVLLEPLLILSPKILPNYKPPLAMIFFWRINTGKEGTSMVAWKDTLTEEQIWQVISFIRTFSQ